MEYPQVFRLPLVSLADSSDIPPSLLSICKSLLYIPLLVVHLQWLHLSSISRLNWSQVYFIHPIRHNVRVISFPDQSKYMSQLHRLIRLLSRRAAKSPMEAAGSFVVLAVALRNTSSIIKQSSLYALGTPHKHYASNYTISGHAGNSSSSHPSYGRTVLLFLALSLVMNGYLLRFISATLAQKDKTRPVYESFGPSESEMTTTTTTPSDVDEPKEGSASIPNFSLDGLDEIFKARGWLPPTPPSDSPSSSVENLSLAPVTIRSLPECINIFENGPRPESLSLSLLNDEEVILLVQNGKIAAHALEKKLDGGHLDNLALERAVRIRRTLICRYSPSPLPFTKLKRYL